MVEPGKPFVVRSTVDDDIPGLFYGETQERVTRWLQDVLHAVRGIHLMSKLNDLQTACMSCAEGGGEAFPNKFTIPLYVLNLVLQPYNLKVEFGTYKTSDDFHNECVKKASELDALKREQKQQASKKGK